MSSAKGLRLFLDDEQQRAWLDGAPLPDDAERPDNLEQRFKFAPKFEKLLRKPQAEDALAILRTYADTCIPIPRTTERFYWSVSCLPSTDRTLARVNASWMELFALQPVLSARAQGEDRAAIVEQRLESAKAGRQVAPDVIRGEPDRRHEVSGKQSARIVRANASDEGLQARFILHLSDFTAYPSPLGEGAERSEAGEDEDTASPSHAASPRGPLPLPGERNFLPGQVDEALIRECAGSDDTDHFFWKADTLGVRVRGPAAIRAFLAHPHSARAIRRFNLTHMNRGRNAYQASHCFSLADAMLDD